VGYVPFFKVELRALPDETLKDQLDVLQQLELNERQEQLDRKAFKLGLLKAADGAARCSHLKANGKSSRRRLWAANCPVSFVRALSKRPISNCRFDCTKKQHSDACAIGGCLV